MDFLNDFSFKGDSSTAFFAGQELNLEIDVIMFVIMQVILVFLGGKGSGNYSGNQRFGKGNRFRETKRIIAICGRGERRRRVIVSTTGFRGEFEFRRLDIVGLF